MSVLGFDDFRFVGPQLLRRFVAAGLVVVLAGTGSCVFAATVYNLIADVVGGIQFIVLEEDTRPRPPARPPAPAARDREASANGMVESAGTAESAELAGREQIARRLS